jgi:hypothetical protein
VALVALTRSGDALVGTVGDGQVDLQLSVPNSQAGVRGSCLGAQMAGYWRIESNFENLDPVGLFLGEWDGVPVFLRSEVHLSPAYGLGRVDVIGTVGERELRCRVAPVDRYTAGRSLVSVDGYFDTQDVTLFGGVSDDYSSAHLDGVIGGCQVSLVATRTAVNGSYAGPAELLPLLIASLLYFV